MPFVSIITPCYNEEENVAQLFESVRQVFEGLSGYTYEHIFIDNASKDGTVAILRSLAAKHKHLKVIVNTRNFGHIRSPYHGLLQTGGEAAIFLAADFQDPPAMIAQFIRKWEEGYKVVLGVKTSSEERSSMYLLRTLYYRLLSGISEVELTTNNTGFGLYDRVVLDTLKRIEDPYPYFRGLLNYIGYEAAKIEFRQPKRKRGITKNNFYTLYDMAMLGVVNHSKVPLRLAAMGGFLMSLLSLFMAGAVVVAKLLLWNHFTVGIAPILISLFFLFSVLLFFVGILGEYVVAIHTQVQKRPWVIEKERINFGSPDTGERHLRTVKK